MDLTLDIPSLRALQYAHMLSIPFENLDIHLGRKIVLDEALLFNKIRGGICYELNICRRIPLLGSCRFLRVYRVRAEIVSPAAFLRKRRPASPTPMTIQKITSPQQSDTRRGNHAYRLAAVASGT
jgi:hypothetical protein